MQEEPLSLYVRLGGESVLTAAVERLSRRVLHDPLLAPAFNGVELGRLRAHQHALLSRLLGVSALPLGQGSGELPADSNWTGPHLDAVATHVVATLSSLGVDPGLIAEVAAGLAPLKSKMAREPLLPAGRRSVVAKA